MSSLKLGILAPMPDFAAARQNMILSQLGPNGLHADSVSDAMAAVPRERFVPEDLQGVAYLDEDLEIAPGRFLMEPTVFARMLQAADLNQDDVVLDLGCASGYSAAVLARLVATVVALESDADLADKASATLADLGIDNAAVIHSDCSAGMTEQGPYNAIFFEGAIDDVPEVITAQLAEDGCLLALVGTGPVGQAVRIVRRRGAVAEQALFDAAIPPLAGFRSADEFQF